MKELVSICIPTYNGSKFIAEALNSAITQTYSNLEIIVSDDASKDDTLEIIEQIKKQTDIPIAIYHHQPNGIGANWNNCIKKASGKYIKFLFQDDIILPSCIEEMVDVLQENKSFGLVACKRTFIIEESYLNEANKKWIKTYGNLQKALQLPLKNGIRILNKKVFKSNFFLSSPLNKVGEPPVTLFRKKLVEEIGYYREDLKQILDYEFYYRILKKHEIAVLEKELVKFRLHEQQATNVNRGNDHSDYKKYYRLMYDDYFWYLNNKKKVELLKIYNPFVVMLLKIKRKLHL